MCEHGRQEGNCPAPPREQHRHPEQQSADTATHRFTGSEPCHGSREVLWQELSIAVVRQQHGCWPLLMPHHPDLPLSCSCAHPPPAPLRLLPIRVWHSHDFPDFLPAEPGRLTLSSRFSPRQAQVNSRAVRMTSSAAAV